MKLILIAQWILIIYTALLMLCMIIEALRKQEASFLLAGFLLLPVSQCWVLEKIRDIRYETLQLNLLLCTMAGFVIAMISDVLIVGVILKNKKKQILVQRLEDVMHERAMRARRHELMEKEVFETGEMCRRYQFQLAKAKGWIEQQDAREIKQLETQLQGEIRKLKQSKVCQNRIVNAVFQEKMQVCADKQIQLSVDICLDEACPIKGFHLCSIYSNLMDNAIEGCQRVEAGTCRFIHIKTIQVKDFLSILIENSCDRWQAKERKNTVRSHHGYGLQILEDTVQIYEGSLKIRQSEGVFETELLLHLKEGT